MRLASRRGVEYRHPRNSDIPFLYLGYQEGVFDFNAIEKQLDMNLSGLDADQFALLLSEMNNAGLQFYVISARNPNWEKHSHVPIGLVGITKRLEWVGEPHVTWMPWATDRNKIEGWLLFLNDMRRDMKLILFTEARNNAFFFRMQQYGVIRRIGPISGYFDRGHTDGVIWQSQ